MKRFIFSALFILIASASLSAQNATVKLKVSGFPKDTTYIHIGHISGNQLLVSDTLRVSENGSFYFESSENEPTLYLIAFPNSDKQAIHLMLEPKDKVEIALQYTDSLKTMDITSAKGSRNIQVYQQFNNILRQNEIQFLAINREYTNPKTTENRKRELSLQFQQAQTTQNIAIRKLLERNTDVLISAFLVTYFDNDINTYIELFESVENGLKKNYADNQFVQYISSKIKGVLVPGREAPEIAMKDPNGNIRKLSDLRGKIVMIDFWASWCRPCRMENPNVVKLYHRYHSKGFEIYSVSLDKQRDQWLQAISQDGLEWDNHVSDLNGWTSSGGAAYGITSVPSTVLIDRQGRIIARNLRGAELENKLREIFGE